MEEGLGLGVEVDDGSSLVFLEENRPEGLGIIGKLRASDDLTVALHLLLYLALFHLGGLGHAFLQGLLRESLLIDALDGFAYKLRVFHHQQRVLGQEL